MDISPPLSPSKSDRLQLPSYAQQLETTQLLRPMAVVQHQQHKQPRQWRALLQQLASRKAACIFYTLLAAGLIWFVAAGRAKPSAAPPPPQSLVIASNGNSSSDPLQPTIVSSTVQVSTEGSDSTSTLAGSSSDSGEGVHKQDYSTATAASSSSSSAELKVRCPYGSLPGTWVSAAPPGSKWQVLNPQCQLKNWLAAYAAAAAAASTASEPAASGDNSDGGTGAAAAAAGDPAAGPATTTSVGSSISAAADVLPYVNILLLSDSVDRYIVQHVCEYLHGAKHTIRAQHHHMQHTPQPPDAAAQPATAPEQHTAGEASSSSPIVAEPPGTNSSSSTPSATVGAAAGAGGTAAGGPSNLNATAYAFHVCQLPESVPIKLASSYFPGVHLTGPFHRGLTQNYAARINAAVAMWEEYAGAGQPPHVVSVASALWDVARLWMHERQQLEGPELGRSLLEGWMANFTAVVQYSRKHLPQTQVWATHTTMLPAHDITTGAMTKPYLGRRYFIEQLNAAAATAAAQLDMQLINYAAVSSRFAEGQKYLTDLIHPNAEVALEVFNLLLNLATEPRGL